MNFSPSTKCSAAYTQRRRTIHSQAVTAADPQRQHIRPDAHPVATWMRTRTAWQLCWIALALRVAVILIGRTYRVRVDDNHFQFAFEAGRIARALVTGRGYADPFDGYSGPTAWLPPLYPLLVALSFKLFGLYTRSAALFLLIANSLFSALVVPAIYEIAARCFDAQGIARRASKAVAPVALWSAWFWTVYPAFLQYAIHWLWEMSLTTCLFTWALVFALRLRGVGGERSRGWIPWAAFGALWGGVALSNASLLLVFPAALLYIAWPQLKRSFAGAVVACLVFALVLAPWVIRNQRTMHAFILTRDNFGVELYQSSIFYHDVFEWGQAVPLDTNDPQYLAYARMGEVAYSHMRGQQAMETLRTHKGTFLRLTAKRFEFFWIGLPHPTGKHPAGELIRNLNYAFLSAAGLWGLALALRRRVPGSVLMLFVFVLAPLVYYAVTVQPRFRHPME
ncbi:MAG: hypothetical protein ABI142_11490, partial [Bryocella sp.]